jgi:hypothetical protein
MHELHKPGRAARQIVSVFVFMFMLAVTANAYTVVMRGGRRIEIPSRFVVTASTLTYEAAPGVQITVQMAAVDIPATEKANNEQPGSLLRRGQLTPESSRPTQSLGKDVQIGQATPTRRTITNRDLESSMRRRRESELAYESRRKQLGLPSVAESRKQAAAESDAIRIELEQRRVAEKESEDYWRGRAAALRTEMTALDAEIVWIRARLDEGPFAMSSGWSNGWANGSFATVTSVVPFISFGNSGRRSFGNFGAGGFPQPGVHRPNVFVAPRQDTRITGRVAFGGGATRGQVLINPGAFPHARPRGIGSRFPGGSVGVFGSTFPTYDYSYERSALITHFNELAAARAGLKARWRELEEEARRAGAQPGWLRP